MGDRRGSITVFMSLAGLLILAMVGTCVETARYATCAGTGAEMLRNGADALLTEYSRPLYDHYGLFFIEDTGESFEKVIADYVNDSLESKAGFSDFLKGELTSLTVTKKTKVGDDRAAPLMQEIVAYMKRYLTAGELGKLLKKINKFSSTEDDAKDIEETVDEEREDKKLDEHIVRLMRLVDGVRVSGSGKVSMEAYFVKKYTTSDPFTGADFGVQESTVWNAMKPRIDKTPVKWKETGSEVLSKLRHVIDATEDAVEEGEAMRATYSTAKHSDLADRVVAGLPSLSGNLRVLRETETLLTDSSLSKKELKKSLKNLWKDYDTTSLSFDYSGIDSAGGGESPLSALGSSLGDGLLSLVCENPDEVSEKAVKMADRYADYYDEEATKGTDYSDRMDRLTENEEVELSGVLGETGSYVLEEFTLDSYITKTFPSFIQKAEGEWKHALDYGWEYVVSGKKSDKKNLESVLSRILLIRAVTNFVAIAADGKKRAEAFAAAAALVGFTGLVFLIRFTQTLILIVWALVESMTDVAALLLQKHVPIVKSSAQVKTTFPEVFLIDRTTIVTRAKRYAEAKKSSFGYREYMWLFMLMTKSELRRYRVMDLIDNDMRKNGYEGFSIGKCVFDMTVKGSFFYPAKLFQLPAIGRMLGRDLSGYEYLTRVRAGYL